MTTSPQNVQQALLDVRKAYRLLHDYQRMVLDAVNYIGKQFGLDYEGGWAQYSNLTPRDARQVDLQSWAWDWLNMMCYEFHFRGPETDAGEIRMSVLLISDTGYFCAKDETLVKTNLAGYLPPEQAATKLGFIISYKVWPDTFFKDKAPMKAFIENDGKLPEAFASNGIVSKCVDISRLASEESTTSLLDELVSLANAAKIPLQRAAMKG